MEWVQYDAQANSGLADDLLKVVDFFKHPERIWHWVVGISFWTATIISIICLIYYAVSLDKKGLQKMWLAIVIYLFIKAVDMSL